MNLGLEQWKRRNTKRLLPPFSVELTPWWKETTALPTLLLHIELNLNSRWQVEGHSTTCKDSYRQRIKTSDDQESPNKL